MSIYSNRAGSTEAEISEYVGALLALLGDQDPVAVLRETPAAVQRFLDSTPPEIVGKPEAPGKWSIGVVIQHLADSELVGGFRLRMILAQDRPPLAGYDQDRWASRLRYDGADVREALDRFKVLRRANLGLWQDLSPADLARVGVHGERGEESLEQLRRLYAGHDVLHLRQLLRIRAAVLEA